MIISASRRTDIPAFYGEWFIHRLEAGYCLVPNPFNPSQVARVSLRRDDVDAIVFWSKNPRPFFRYLDRIEAPYYFLFTLNDYPQALEPALPPLTERIAAFRELAERLGPRRVIWRYDPIIMSDAMDAAYHLERFGQIAEALQGATTRAIVSFIDFYRKTERRLGIVEERTGERFCRDPLRNPELPLLVSGLLEIAERHGLELRSCAEDPALERLGLEPGKCIDDELICGLWGIAVPGARDRGQRELCRCAPSRDVGVTDTCLHGCEYCYSTVSQQAAQRRAGTHDPRSPALVGSPASDSRAS